MSDVSNFVATAILNLNLTTTVYVGLLTADPLNVTATAIANETAIAANDTAYLRKSTAFVASTVIGENPDRVKRNNSVIAFPNTAIAAVNYTVTHIAIWDSGTTATGNLLYTVKIPFVIVRVPNRGLAIPIGSLGIKVL